MSSYRLLLLLLATTTTSLSRRGIAPLISATTTTGDDDHSNENVFKPERGKVWRGSEMTTTTALTTEAILGGEGRDDDRPARTRSSSRSPSSSSSPSPSAFGGILDGDEASSLAPTSFPSPSSSSPSPSSRPRYRSADRKYFSDTRGDDCRFATSTGEGTSSRWRICAIYPAFTR